MEEVAGIVRISNPTSMIATFSFYCVHYKDLLETFHPFSASRPPPILPHLSSIALPRLDIGQQSVLSISCFAKIHKNSD